MFCGAVVTEILFDCLHRKFGFDYSYCKPKHNLQLATPLVRVLKEIKKKLVPLFIMKAS